MVLSAGPASTSPSVQGLDRFYCPPQRRQLLAAAAAKDASLKENNTDNGEVLTFPQKEEELVEERRVVESNLERFLASTSLLVPAQFFPRVRISNYITTAFCLTSNYRMQFSRPMVLHLTFQMNFLCLLIGSSCEFICNLH
jgi:hypothetical protein